MQIAKQSKFPGWRHMTASERYNAKAAALWDHARAMERERRRQGLEPNLSLLPPDEVIEK